MLLCCNVISRQVSTANFACWLVLVCYNLQSLSSEFSATCLSLTHCNLVSLSSEVSFPFFQVLFRCKVACLSLAVWVVRLAQSLTLSFSTFHFCAIAGLLAPALIWEHHSVSWSERALEYCLYVIVSIFRPHRSVCTMFQVKRVSICIYGTAYVRQIYNWGEREQAPH